MSTSSPTFVDRVPSQTYVSHGFAIFVAAGLILATAGVSLAQTQAPKTHPKAVSKTRTATQPSTKQSPPAQEPDRPAEASADSTLTGELFKFPSIGLTMRLPGSTIWQGTALGTTNMTYQIKPDEPVPVWVVTARVSQSERLELTLKDACDEMIRTLEESFGKLEEEYVKPGAKTQTRRLISTQAKVLDRQVNLRFGGKPGEQFFVSIPEGTDKPVRVVRGFTVAHLEPGKFLVMELRVAESNLSIARPLFLDMTQTISFADPQALSAARGVAIKAGQALLDKLGETDYKALASGKPVFMRCYKPAVTGDPMDATEVGYHQMTVKIGVRGQVDATTPPSRYTISDNDKGLLVQIKSRVLEPQDGISPTLWPRIDSEGSFFMSVDRASENWSLSMTQHDGQSGKSEKPPVWIETGAREGRSMSVSLIAPGAQAQTRRVQVPKEGYLSLAEVYILPQLLVRSQAALDFSFYAYRSKNESIVMRADALSRPADKPGVWQLASRVTDDDPVIITTYKDDPKAGAKMIRRELADGTVWEPVDPKWLLELWQRKGYPTK
jgi:hypothetical protein